MSLGKKEKLSGMIVRRKVNVGTASEHDAVMIVVDNEKNQPLKLRIKGGNPFHDPALDPFVGQHVSLVGVRASGLPLVQVDSVADIKVLGPPGPAIHPRRPKGPSL